LTGYKTKVKAQFDNELKELGKLRFQDSYKFKELLYPKNKPYFYMIVIEHEIYTIYKILKDKNNNIKFWKIFSFNTFFRDLI
jgi:hypothetical protein